MHFRTQISYMNLPYICDGSINGWFPNFVKQTPVLKCIVDTVVYCYACAVELLNPRIDIVQLAILSCKELYISCE